MTTSPSSIPDAAVDAALVAIFPEGPISDFSRATWTRTVTAILEAAAPHIEEAALKGAADAWREYLPAVAGYGKVQPVPVWLERRAEWVAL